MLTLAKKCEGLHIMTSCMINLVKLGIITVIEVNGF